MHYEKKLKKWIEKSALNTTNNPIPKFIKLVFITNFNE